jgi:hypothetical protein
VQSNKSKVAKSKFFVSQFGEATAVGTALPLEYTKVVTLFFAI